MKTPLPKGPCFCGRHTLDECIYLRIQRNKRDVHTRKWCGLWRDVRRDIQTVADLAGPLKWPRSQRRRPLNPFQKGSQNE